MGETICLQPLATFRGKLTAAGSARENSLNQPAAGWGQTGRHQHATFHVHILRQEGSGASAPKLLLETGATPSGPWYPLESFERGGTPPPDPPTNAVVGASVGATAGTGKMLERYFRWRIDVTALADTDTWAMCFGICVTLR